MLERQLLASDLEAIPLPQRIMIERIVVLEADGLSLLILFFCLELDILLEEFHGVFVGGGGWEVEDVGGGLVLLRDQVKA